MRIRIVSGEVSLVAEVEDCPTTEKLLQALPCESKANTWGQEVYFQVPVTAEKSADARQVVDPGTVCFWVEGSSLALPFGPTPISEREECRLAAKVNVLGKLVDDPQKLSRIENGDAIRVEAMAE